MRILLIFILILLPLFAGAENEVVAITNGRIYTMTGPVIETGVVLIRDGKIEDVGASVSIPPGARIIDAAGKNILPGFIDANCHAGLEEINAVSATVDSSESVDPVTPQMRVVDGFFPESNSLGVSRVNGVVACVVSPSSINVFTGISALMEFSEMQVDRVAIQPAAAMNITLGEAPKALYGERNKMPQTRMGTAALIRETLWKAREYGEKWKRKQEQSSQKKSSDENERSQPERDLKLESLQDVLNGKLPIVVSAHRVDDILTAIRIAEEFGLKQSLIINHGTEAYKIASLLASEKIPVIVGPVTTQPDRMETLGAVYENAALLHKAGVLIAIQTDETHNMRNLPYEAGLAVAAGLPYEEALRAITLNPAKIFRIDQLGAIEKGKRANLIISKGDPLEPRTEITNVFIGGQELPDSSYHRQLWEDFQRRTAQ